MLWTKSKGEMGDDQKYWLKAEEELRQKITTNLINLIEDPTYRDILLSNPSFLSPSEIECIILPRPSLTVISSFSNLVAAIVDGTRNLIDLHWREFEDLLAEILEKSGWNIRPMGYTKDGGIDIVAVRKIEPGIPIEMMVQCKRNKPKRPVGLSIIREVWSVKLEKQFHQAMIATTSYFTKGARQKAYEWNLDLRDYDAIFNWCKKIDKR